MSAETPDKSDLPFQAPPKSPNMGEVRVPNPLRRSSHKSRWRHTLLHTGGPPFDLVEGQDVVIGRHRNCDLTIPSKRVSRKHTAIVWRGSQPVVQDLGSQNGTKVDGKRIKEEILDDGAEIEIGPFMCTYRKVNANLDVEPEDKTEESDVTMVMGQDSLVGSFDQMGPFEVLQTLEFNSKTGTLEVYGKHGEATLVVRDGVPQYCKIPNKEGDEAALELLTWKNGQFVFGQDIETSERNMSMRVTNLLFEAGRRMDEGSMDEGLLG